MKNILTLLTILITLSTQAQVFELGQTFTDIKKVPSTEIQEMSDAIICTRYLTANSTATCLVSYITRQVYIQALDVKNTPYEVYTRTIKNFKEDFKIINAEIIQDDVEGTTYETVFRDRTYVDNVAVYRITSIKYDYISRDLKIMSMINYYNE